MSKERIIAHVDMDAFFASIEQRDNPQYRGKPVVVGADPKGGRGRGVVATCSYEARRFGIHSAQPISEAWRLCPHAVFLPPRGEAYEAASRHVRRVLEEFTPVIEEVSIDEAFLDLTGSLHLFTSKRELGLRLQRRIEEETSLTASVGIAPNKMVAKIASDMNKPRGLVIVEPNEVEAFLRPLPVQKLWGVGEKTAKFLHEQGVKTIGDLADMPREKIAERFGKSGEYIWELAHGVDERPVEPETEAKSIGAEHTFEADTADFEFVKAVLLELCERVASRLRAEGVCGRTVTTKLRFENFDTFTRARTVDTPVQSTSEIFHVARSNMERVDRRGRRVRLIGVTVSSLQHGGPRQMALFDRDTQGRTLSEKEQRLGKAMDSIRRRFGDGALLRGTSLLKPERRKRKNK
jgi:DNA polymerase-4